MSRLALVLAFVALGAAAASLWMIRTDRNSMEQMRRSVETKGRDHKMDVERWMSRWREGRGIPIPVRAPGDLAGVSRIEWSDRSLDLWGWNDKKCQAEGGEHVADACRFKIADIGRGASPASENRLSSLPVHAESLLVPFQQEIEAIRGESISWGCKEEGPLNSCELHLDLGVPTVRGIGEFLGRLKMWPIVLTHLTWEDGELQIRGYVLGGAS